MYKMGLNSIFFLFTVEKNRNRVNMSIKLICYSLTLCLSVQKPAIQEPNQQFLLKQSKNKLLIKLLQKPQSIATTRQTNSKELRIPGIQILVRLTLTL